MKSLKKKNVTRVWRDDCESDHFTLCRYRTITQIGTVLRWFCVITARAFREQKCSCPRFVPDPTVIRRHDGHVYSSPPSFRQEELELETLFKSVSNHQSIASAYRRILSVGVRNMYTVSYYDPSGEIQKRVVPI